MYDLHIEYSLFLSPKHGIMSPDVIIKGDNKGYLSTKISYLLMSKRERKKERVCACVCMCVCACLMHVCLMLCAHHVI